MRLYHISQDPNLKELAPRIPDNFFVENGYEDDYTPRVSFCKTVYGCLRGLSMNVTGKIFYVYQPVTIDSKAVVYPTKDKVPDVETTHEIWYIKPVRVIPVYIIEAGDMVKPKRFTYGEYEAENYTSLLMTARLISEKQD